jgi:nucleotide-binding universal stress UspA family protein
MRLLMAVDLNDHAEELVTQGAAWARRLGGILDLIYVDDVYLVQDPAIRSVLVAQWTQIRKEQDQRLAGLLATLPEDLRGEILYRSGSAPDEIAAAAKGRDLVLISTHGRRGLSHALLGSVAERVVRLSPVPVLVLRTSPSVQDHTPGVGSRTGG